MVVVTVDTKNPLTIHVFIETKFSTPKSISNIPLSLIKSREKTVISNDIASDPTLPRANARCSACEHREAVVFQSAASRTEKVMALYFVCVNCGNRWKE